MGAGNERGYEMRIITIGLFALMLAVAKGGELLTTEIGADQSHVSQANGQIYGFTWQNQTGGSVYIVGYQFFMGMSYGSLADFTCYLYRGSDYQTIGFRGWDHYSSPTGADSNNPQTWFPDGTYILINPGDTVNFECLGSGFTLPPGGGAPVGSMVSLYQANAWIFYVTQQP